MESEKVSPEKATIILLDEHKFAEILNRILDAKLHKILHPAAPIKHPEPLDDYIPKSAVRDKLLSSSTLWKLEQKGNLKTYAIGGKRYYKRSEIESLIQEVKK